MKYFRMSLDDSLLDVCYLSRLRASTESVDPRRFTMGRPYDGPNGHLALSMEHTGRIVDVNFSDFDMPVVTKRVATAISSMADGDIELFEVLVDGERDSLFILNAVRNIDCFDRAHSFFIEWKDNEFRADKAGLPKLVVRLAIDPDKVAGHHIFRVQDWLVALVVSEDVKVALQNEAAVGAKFTPVTLTGRTPSEMHHKRVN